MKRSKSHTDKAKPVPLTSGTDAQTSLLRQRLHEMNERSEKEIAAIAHSIDEAKAAFRSQPQ